MKPVAQRVASRTDAEWSNVLIQDNDDQDLVLLAGQ
jgi:hypothetical protein